LVLRCGSAGVVWYPYAGWSSASACIEPAQYNTWNKSTISRKLLKMDVLTFETCSAVNSEIIKQVNSRFKFVYTPTWSLTDCQYTDDHKTHSHSSIVVDICSELYSNKMRIVENRGRGLLTTWLSGHWLWHNSQWLNGMTWCSPVLNLTHIGKYGEWVDSHLCHEVKYNYHWTHFHETCTHNKISSKSDTQFNCWQ
jgi:hypothetical protein